MAGLEKISKKVNACVTCDNWKGELRHSSPNRQYVIYESYQRGVCTGILKAGHSMAPLNKCKAWRIWSDLKKPMDTDESIFGEQSDTWWDEDEHQIFFATRDASDGLRPSTYVQEILKRKDSRSAGASAVPTESDQPKEVVDVPPQKTSAPDETPPEQNPESQVEQGPSA